MKKQDTFTYDEIDYASLARQVGGMATVDEAHLIATTYNAHDHVARLAKRVQTGRFLVHTQNPSNTPSTHASWQAMAALADDGTVYRTPRRISKLYARNIDQVAQSHPFYLLRLMKAHMAWRVGDPREWNEVLTRAHMVRIGCQFQGFLTTKPTIHDEYRLVWAEPIPHNSWWRYQYVLATAFDDVTRKALRKLNMDAWLDMFSFDHMLNYDKAAKPWYDAVALAKVRKDVLANYSAEIKRMDV